MPSAAICFALLMLSTAVAAVSNVQATPSKTSPGMLTVTWTADGAESSPFTIALVSKTYSGPLAVANNVDPQSKSAEIPLPDFVPGSDYTVALLSMSDTSDIIASSAPFGLPPANPPPPPIPTPKTTASGTATVTATSRTASGSAHSASVTVATHTGSASGSVIHSGSVIASKSLPPTASATAPLSTVIASAASSIASEVKSAISGVIPASILPTVHTTAPAPSTSAHTGGAVSTRVPFLGFAFVIGGVLVGALGF
ncbi:hypothetical protein C8F04DRAFT_291791 [Mycena alexandri]|uniref:Yeast cell wall synthesis Kre9/Knh1-like N-terminal domain-containing protein n=1 Tax=Mycena alexandri TaxID=1745969 RepID=A0AAD6S597_9AGAR|nr:hypothetical protein C8F04DRAFT_291791 [Mycena alexandri]